MGRMTKHLGDLSLQAGLPQEALAHYNTAVDVLRAITDWLWLGGKFKSWRYLVFCPINNKVSISFEVNYL